MRRPASFQVLEATGLGHGRCAEKDRNGADPGHVVRQEKPFLYLFGRTEPFLN
jgi:hypothetical protein